MFDLKLNLGALKDDAVRYALDNVQRALLRALFLNGEFRLIDYTFPAPGNYQIAHGLGFVPLDMIDLYRTSGLIVNAYPQDRTSTVIPCNAGSAGRWRFIVGSFKGV